MGEWSPIIPPEPDLRVQFSDWIDHGYVPMKRFEPNPEPCILCGRANCTGEDHGEVQEHDPSASGNWWEGTRGSDPDDSPDDSEGR